jgi:hypothetical protein
MFAEKYLLMDCMIDRSHARDPVQSETHHKPPEYGRQSGERAFPLPMSSF